MAKSTGGDWVLQLLHEFREHQQDYKHFKHEMLSFKQFAEQRMDLLHQGMVQTHDYLKLLVKMIQDMGDVRQRVNRHDEQLADHEQRLDLLEK